MKVDYNMLDYIRFTITKHKDWKQYILKRHHKFLITFIENSYSIEEVARQFSYSASDMFSIFTRIENQLKLMEKKKTFSFPELPKSQEEELCSILYKIQSVKDLSVIFPPRLVEIFSVLLVTRSLEQTSKVIKMKYPHFMFRIFGRNKPRKPCEQGAFYYVDKYFSSQTVDSKTRIS